MADGTPGAARVLLLDTTRHLTAITADSATTVRAQTGVSMEALLAHLADRGLGLTAVPAPGELTLGGVLAIGGGAVLAEATRALLRDLPVVFLEVPLADAVKRVGLDAPRPLLAVNPRARWRELMEARRPLYLEVATAVVDTAGHTPEQVADAVLEALELKTPHD